VPATAPDLWQHAHSELFDYGTELLIVVYENSPILRFPPGLSQKNLSDFVTKETPWLTPLDGNIGFIVGIPTPTAFDEIRQRCAVEEGSR
jgi:hypothetical protein